MKEWELSRIFPKKRSRKSLVIAFAAMLLLTTCLMIRVNPAHATLTWTTETVDNSGKISNYNSIAVAPNGTAEISYCDSTDGYLMYAARTGSPWATQIVDSSSNMAGATPLQLVLTTTLR
jgi:uncharacterized protein YraI